MIATPTVHPDLIENWPNSIGLFRQSDCRPSWHDSTLPAMYSLRDGYRYDATFKPMIKTAIPSFSSTAALQLLLATFLGCERVFLYGCDFGYEHYNGEYYKTRFNAKPELVAADNLAASDNGCPSDSMQLFYKRNFLTAARLALSPRMVVGEGGAIGDEVPRVDSWHDARDVIESKEIRKARLETYLSNLGCFTIETDSGALLFVESSDYAHEIPAFCERVNAEGAHHIDIARNMGIIRSRLRHQ